MNTSQWLFGRFGRSLLLLFATHFSICTQCLEVSAEEKDGSDGAKDAHVDPPETNKFIDRLLYLLDQLVSVEARISVIDEAIRKAAHKSVSAGRTANNFEKNNERMDRHAGGPKPWKEFYGEVAKDFYMPGGFLTGPKQVERPTQFDYLYRANQKHIDQARHDVASWGHNVKELVAYRRNLEKERSTLWAVITLERIQNKAIPQRSLYHWRLTEQSKSSSEGLDENPKVAVLRSAILVLRTIDVTASEGIARLTSGKTDIDHQENVYLVLRQTIKDARIPAEEAAIHYRDTEGETTENGQRMVTLLGHYTRLDSAAANTCDAYRRAVEVDEEKEKEIAAVQQLKLQQSLINVAGETIKLDDTITEFASAWKIVGKAGVNYPDQILNPWQPVSISDKAVPVSEALPLKITDLEEVTQSSVLNNLREIKVKQSNGQWFVNKVVHDVGKTYVVRANGSRALATQRGHKFSWQNAKGITNEIDTQTNTNQAGSQVQLNYGPQDSSPVSVPQPPSKPRRPKANNKRG